MPTRPLANLRRALIATVSIAVALGAAALLRDWAAERGLTRLATRLSRHGVHMRHTGYHWEGWRQLCVEGLRFDGPKGLTMEVDTLHVLLRPWEGLGFAAVEQLDFAGMRLLRGRLRWDLQVCARPQSARLAMRITQADGRGPDDAVSGLHAQLLTWRASGALHVTADWQGFDLRHRLLAAEAVNVVPGSLALQLRPRLDTILLEKGSRVDLGAWHTALGGTFAAASSTLHLHAQCPLQPAADLLATLPDAAKGRLCDAQLGGWLGGSAALSVRPGQPESLVLEAAVRDSAFGLLAGGPDFAGWRAVAQAGPRWSQRLPAPILHALLLSEDAGFLAHQGFDAAFIGSALAQDWSSGRFERGGGTLSMQLIRNLFLRREKRLARKLEEAALTLLAERGGLLDKTEILDLYLDRVEWGPGIYGISAASAHYFACRPEALSLDQGLFLMAALPNPRMSHTLLEADGRLGGFAQGYFDGMRWLLYQDGFVEEAELDRDYPVFERVRAAKGV